MTDQVSEALEGFFDFIWGSEPGQVYIATLNKGGEFSQYLPEWPRHKTEIVRMVLAQNAEGKDVYYSPSVFLPQAEAPDLNDQGKMRASRENVRGAQVFWVDIDGGAPTDWTEKAKEHGIPEPSMVIQSSTEDRQHVYWRTKDFLPADDVEQSNRTLAFTLGADSSGWDANQLLRPPFTSNYGYKGNGDRKDWFAGEPQPVRIAGRVSKERVGADDFSTLASAERQVLDGLSIGDNVPGIREVLALGKWSPELWDQFNQTGEAIAASGDRSGAYMRMLYLAAESGMSNEQMYALQVEVDPIWGKYTKRSPGQRHKIFLDNIARARAKVGYLTEENLTFAGLLSKVDEAEDGVPKLIYGFEEFMSLEVNIDWHIENLLAHKGLGLITGPPGTGKTQLGIQLGMSIALGKEHAGGWSLSGGPKKVVFLSCEMDKDPLRIFYNAIAPAYEGEGRMLQKNFKIAPLGAGIPLDKPEGFQFLDNLLSDQKPDVLFIDSLQKIISKSLTNEDAAKELMNNIMLLKKKHSVAIYLVHHNRKESKDRNGNYTKQELHDLYGSVFIAAEVDFVMALRKTAVKGTLAIDTWKNRLAEERDTFHVKRDDNLQFKEVDVEEDSAENFDGLRIIGTASRTEGSGDSKSPFSGGTGLTI